MAQPEQTDGCRGWIRQPEQGAQGSIRSRKNLSRFAHRRTKAFRRRLRHHQQGGIRCRRRATRALALDGLALPSSPGGGGYSVTAEFFSPGRTRSAWRTDEQLGALTPGKAEGDAGGPPRRGRPSRVAEGGADRRVGRCKCLPRFEAPAGERLAFGDALAQARAGMCRCCPRSLLRCAARARLR